MLAGAGGWTASLFLRTDETRSGSGQTAASQATPVVAGVAKLMNVPDYVQALGSVQSIDSVGVLPRVGGPITELFFRPGQDVKKGQPLFQIDPRPYQAALDQAQGQLAHDQAALAEARVDLARYQQLAKTRAAPEQQAADQAYVVKQAEGTVELDQANVENAKLNLSYCRITSPIDGRAGALNVDVGNVVQPTTTTPLVTITQMHPIYVTFGIPEQRLDEVRKHQAKAPLEVEAHSQSGRLIATGKLTLIDNQVNSSTGTIMLKATFRNKSEALWPGEFVTVHLIVYTRHNAITVPAQTVMAGPTGSYVYIVKPNDTVERVAVQVAARQNGIAVISRGISAGQRVVTEGQYRLANNVRVRIRPSNGPS